MADQPHLAGLDDDQRAAACQDTESPCVIVAGPGGGKTRTLCARILHILSLGVSPANVVAITFTRKAASEMRERMQRLLPVHARSPTIKTFHSFALAMLRMHTVELGFPRPFKASAVVTGKQVYQLVRESVVAVLGEEQATRPNVAQYNALIKSAKAHGHDPSHLSDNARNVFKTYQDKLRFQYALDLADFVRVACELLAKSEVVRRRYRNVYLLVDEFQDANQQQLKLCQVITEHSRRLTVVGDINQSIYAFRGASPTFNFEKLGAMGSRTIHLTTNYRSTAHIVESSEALIAFNNKRKDTPKIKAKGGRDGPKIKVIVCDSSVTEAQKVVALLKAMSKEELCNCAVLCRTHAIVVEIQTELSCESLPHHTSTSQQHMTQLFGSSMGGTCLSFVVALCTLAHSPADFKALESMVKIKRVVPKMVTSQVKKILRDAPATTVEEALSQILDADTLKPGTRKQVVNFMQTLNELRDRSRVSVSATMSWLSQHVKLRELEDTNANASPPAASPPASAGAGDDAGPGDGAGDEEDVEDDIPDDVVDDTPDGDAEKGDAVQALIHQARLFDSVQSRSSGQRGSELVLKTFCEWIEKRKSEHLSRGTSAKGVALLTIHASKGLEWDTVILPRFNEGVIPNAHALKSLSGDDKDNNVQLQEERRLAYVAITRSQRRCIMTCALYDTANSRPMHPSRFLDEIPAQCKESSQVEGNAEDAGGAVGHRRDGLDPFGLGIEVDDDPHGHLFFQGDPGPSAAFTTARKLVPKVEGHGAKSLGGVAQQGKDGARLNPYKQFKANNPHQGQQRANAPVQSVPQGRASSIAVGATPQRGGEGGSGGVGARQPHRPKLEALGPRAASGASLQKGRGAAGSAQHARPGMASGQSNPSQRKRAALEVRPIAKPGIMLLTRRLVSAEEARRVFEADLLVRCHTELFGANDDADANADAAASRAVGKPSKKAKREKGEKGEKGGARKRQKQTLLTLRPK